VRRGVKLHVGDENSKALFGEVQIARNRSGLLLVDAGRSSVRNVGLAKSTRIPGLQDKLKFLKI